MLYRTLGPEYAFYPEDPWTAQPSCAPPRDPKKIELANRREHIPGNVLMEYVKRARDYSYIIFGTNKRLGTMKDVGHSDAPALFNEKSAQVLRLIEHEVPSYAIFINILLNPQACDNIPNPTMIQLYYDSLTKERNRCLKDIHKQKDVHYSLYFYNKHVAECVDGALKVLDDWLYKRCQYPAMKCYDNEETTEEIIAEMVSAIEKHIRQEKHSQEVLTEEMIDEVIHFQIVPKDRRDELMQSVGHKFTDLLNEIKAYGDSKRFIQIEREEILMGMGEAQAIANYVHPLLAKEEHQIVANLRYNHFSTDKNTEKTPEKIKQVYKYLKGQIALKDLGITNDNAMEFLIILKTIRWTASMRNRLSRKKIKFVPGADANLRSMLLTVLPKTSTHWVFLKTLVEENLKNPEYWRESRNYINERAEQQMHEMAALKAATESLALRIKKPECVGARGTSGAGKSVWIRSHIGNVDVEGVLSPDSAKAKLKHTPSHPSYTVLNQQVHYEGAALFANLFDEVKQDKKMRFVVDQRLLTADKVQTDLIEPAKSKGCTVALYDIESSSITRLFLRMLTRPAFGGEPCQECQIITNGYKDSIRFRKDVIELTQQKTVRVYKLILDDKVVAEKGEEGLVIYDEKAFEYCTKLPANIDDVIKDAENTLVTAELINQAVKDRYIFAEQRPFLEYWLNESLGNAVNKQANGGGLQLPAKAVAPAKAQATEKAPAKVPAVNQQPVTVDPPQEKAIFEDWPEVAAKELALARLLKERSITVTDKTSFMAVFEQFLEQELDMDMFLEDLLKVEEIVEAKGGKLDTDVLIDYFNNGYFDNPLSVASWKREPEDHVNMPEPVQTESWKSTFVNMTSALIHGDYRSLGNYIFGKKQ